MGRTRKSGGVAPSRNRIQFTFWYLGKRRRPTVDLSPTKTNLDAAKRRLIAIEKAIDARTFRFSDEFPDYKGLPEIVAAEAAAGAAPALKPEEKRPTVSKVCEDYIATLRARRELAFATVESYRKILTRRVENHVDAEGRRLGDRVFAEISFSDLNGIATAHAGAKKTFNNVVSAIHGAWHHGYKDLPGQKDPALGLECVRIPKREQPKPDPFPVDEAEDVVAAIRRDWGELQGNYEEFRFFGGGGLRPSEEIALEWTDMDFSRGELAVSKARVMGRAKDETKNYVDRLVEVTPRGMEIMRRQRALYSELKLAGKIAIDTSTGEPHNRIFFHETGIPFNNLQVPWKRWDSTMQRLKKRTRTPYQARDSSVSWMLMIGKNFLWVAEQHGHSAAVMLKTYAKWLRGATAETVEQINAAFGFASNSPAATAPRAQVVEAAGGVWRSERDSNPSPAPAGSTSYSGAPRPDTPGTPPQSPHLPADLPAARRRRRN
jgi:integrase